MTPSLRLAFTGDVCLGAGAFEKAGDRSLDTMLRPFAERFADHDLVVGNLECALLPPQAPAELRARKMAVPVARAAGLRASGFTVLTLANNHVLDCDGEGLDATLRELGRQGIAACGAGTDLASATAPLAITARGRRVTIVTACDHSAHFATPARPGIAPLAAERLLEQVGTARGNSDLIVAILHADLEFSDYPAPWRIALARKLAAAGAHLVIQHHPHVFQGYERRGGSLLAYSLGNFVFKVQGNAYQEHFAQTAEGLVLSASVDFGADAPVIAAEFIPVRIGPDHFPQLAHGADAAAILARLETLSAGLRDVRTVRAAWRERCRREAGRWAHSAYYDLRRGKLREAVRDLRSALAVPEDRRWLAGWLSRGAR